MKPVVTLYLLVNDHDYRLIRSTDHGLFETPHGKAELHGAAATRVPGHPPKENAERVFMAKHAAKVLALEWAHGTYDRIVLAAGPKMLGEIRQDLPRALHGHIVAEIHKDLVKIPLHDLPDHFKGAVPAV